MIRVNKNIARNQYNQGKIIRLIPAKLNFDTKVFQDVYLGKYATTDFDELVDIRGADNEKKNTKQIE